MTCITGKRSDLYQKNHPDWLPSVGMTGQQRSPEETGTSRYKLHLNRTQQRLKDEAAAAPAAAGTNDNPLTSDYISSNLCNIGTQTDMTGDFIEAMTLLKVLELKTFICPVIWHIYLLPMTKVHLLIRMERFYFSLACLHTRYCWFSSHSLVPTSL